MPPLHVTVAENDGGTVAARALSKGWRMHAGVLARPRQPWSNAMPPVTHMVPMRDGIRLATDIHLPGATGSFPVIMERTPYGRAETSRSEITAANRTPAARADIAAYFA